MARAGTHLLERALRFLDGVDGILLRLHLFVMLLLRLLARDLIVQLDVRFLQHLLLIR